MRTTGTPKRSIIRRRVAGALALSAVLALPACSGVQVRIGSADAPSGVSPAAPADVAVFPRVLSTTMADSGGVATAQEIAAAVAIDDTGVPAGFRRVTVVVDEGLGSFAWAAPASFTSLWRAGTSPADLLAEAELRDPAWAEFARGVLGGAQPDGLLRAVVLNTANPDDVVTLVITLADGFPGSADAEAESMRAEFGGTGRAVHDAHAVRVNGADGAYAAFDIPVGTQGATEPRAGVQVRIPDLPNDLSWGLTCEGPATGRAALADLCADVAATFRPLPAIVG